MNQPDRAEQEQVPQAHRWEEKLEDLVEALRESERREGRPPTREVVSRLMERCAGEDLD